MRLWTHFRLQPFMKQPSRIRQERPGRAFAVFALVFCQPHFGCYHGPAVRAFTLSEKRSFHSPVQRFKIAWDPSFHSLACSNASTIRLFSSTPSSSSSDLSPQESPLYREIQHLPRLYMETSHDASTTSGLTQKALVPMTTGQAHYLLDVMRITNTKRWGHEHAGCVRIFNGKDGEWLAKVVELNTGGSKKRRRKSSGGGGDSEIAGDAVLECVECVIPQPANDNTRPTIELYLGLLKKKQQLKWVCEKVTELGVDGITLLDTDYSMGGGGSSKYNNADRGPDDPWDYDKHKTHVVEAAEQSERLTLPTLQSNLLLWEDLVERIRSGYTKDSINYWLVCRERSESSPPILSILQAIQAKHEDFSKDGKKVSPRIHIGILVGPEGGWSPTELETFESILSIQHDHDKTSPFNQLQFVSLGSSVLRAETAAVTAVACVKMHQDAQDASS